MVSYLGGLVLGFTPVSWVPRNGGLGAKRCFWDTRRAEHKNAWYVAPSNPFISALCLGDNRRKREISAKPKVNVLCFAIFYRFLMQYIKVNSGEMDINVIKKV